MVAAILEGAGVTIDVAKLRRFAEEAGWPSVSPSEFVELLDAYEAHSECETIQEQVVAVSRRWHELYNAEFDKTKALTEERDRLREALEAIEGAISLTRPSLFNQSLSNIARAALEGRE